MIFSNPFEALYFLVVELVEDLAEDAAAVVKATSLVYAAAEACSAEMDSCVVVLLVALDCEGWLLVVRCSFECLVAVLAALKSRLLTVSTRLVRLISLSLV